MKNKFITAYMYAYGCTKKKALETYKSASAYFIQAVIDNFNNDCHQAFYND